MVTTLRIAVAGGTRFIGAAIVEELATAGHDVTVVHRGRREVDDAPQVRHVHCDRRDAGALRAALSSIDADVVVDTCAYARADAEHAVSALGSRARAVVLSSMDVYRAFATVLAGGAATDAVPLDETAAVRGESARFIHRGHPLPPGADADPETYEKLDVESVYLARGATVLRLPVVYGERDPMRREDFVLRRLRAGRTHIPIGTGTWVWTRGYVRDIARALRLVVEAGGLAGEVFNIGEARTWTIDEWAREILRAAGSDTQLVRVPDDALPADLQHSGSVAQDLLVDSSKARRVLGWSDTDPAEALARSVAWHSSHAPAAEEPEAFVADDLALSRAIK